MDLQAHYNGAQQHAECTLNQPLDPPMHSSGSSSPTGNPYRGIRVSCRFLGLVATVMYMYCLFTCGVLLFIVKWIAINYTTVL